ncbi:MAG: rRNA maturation RNase YbeY [Bacteroidota bacterium]
MSIEAIPRDGSFTNDRINFFTEDISFELPDQEKIKRWICEIIDQEKGELSNVNIIFCSDKYLYQMNIEYLNHDTLTDVITFPYQEFPTIEGDIFISIERVQENADVRHLSFLLELSRVIIHGILHLCGYKDKTKQDQLKMRQKEDTALVIKTNL